VGDASDAAADKEKQVERMGLTPDWIIQATAFKVFQLPPPPPEQPFIKGLLDPCTNSLLAPNIPAEKLYDKVASTCRVHAVCTLCACCVHAVCMLCACCVHAVCMQWPVTPQSRVAGCTPCVTSGPDHVSMRHATEASLKSSK